MVNKEESFVYINYANDRKELGYKCLMDTQCGNELVLITDSSVVFVRNVGLYGKRKIIVIIFTIIVILSDVEPAESIGTSPPLQTRVVRIMSNQNTNKLMKPSKAKLDLEIKPKIIMPSWSVRTKSDLRNSQWIKKFISEIRGGDNEKLIKSIISKVSESEWDMPSINKILKKLAEVTLEIGTNDKLLRILAELEKPVPNYLFAEGFVPRLPHRKQNKVEEPKYSSSSIEFLLDSTKCYGHREAYNMPRSVSEQFETTAVSKLATDSLKNSYMQKEYTRIKKSLNDGIHPVNIGKKSTFVSADKVLIKASKGRYLVKVSDTQVDILGFVPRGNDKGTKSFENIMNKIYSLDLKGY